MRSKWNEQVKPIDTDKDGTNDDDKGSKGRKHEGRERSKRACRPTRSPPPSQLSRSHTNSTSDSIVDSALTELEEKLTLCCTKYYSQEVAVSTPLLQPVVDGDMHSLIAKECTAQAWIEAVTGKTFLMFASRSFARNVKNGELLCELVNGICPGAISEVYRGSIGYKQVDNIDNFLAACRKLGVQRRDLFTITDAYEMKGTWDVIKCVYALGSVVHASCPMFTGPLLRAPADASVVTSTCAFHKDNADNEVNAYTRSSPASPSATTVQSERRDQDSRGDDNEHQHLRGLMLNMEDVEHLGTPGRACSSAVGNVSDPRLPALLSNRTLEMCPKERLAYSPRALALDADLVSRPIPPSSLEKLARLTPGGAGPYSYDARGTREYSPNHLAPKASFKLSSTAPLETASCASTPASGSSASESRYGSDSRKTSKETPSGGEESGAEDMEGNHQRVDHDDSASR